VAIVKSPIAQIVWKLTSKLIDVESAFLHRELEEAISMDCPSRMEHQAYEYLLLQKTICGLVQSTGQFYKKLMKTLRKIGFTGGRADPCLLTQRSKKGIVYVACYMYDIFAVGHREAIKEVVDLIKAQGLNVKVQDELTDYLSCNVLFNCNKSIAWLGQPHLIKNIERKFGAWVKKLKKWNTRAWSCQT
jgi:hypothetical protein